MQFFDSVFKKTKEGASIAYAKTSEVA